jgi:hypothetical protein
MEQERGCGWRKIGGFYLCGEGVSVACDGLPLDLEPCSECGFAMGFSRGVQLIPRGYLESKVQRAHKTRDCTDTFPCAVCTPGQTTAFMWVSKDLYSPSSFIAEARKMGVSKRFARGSLPREFKIGQTWVLLAHKKANFLKDPQDFTKGYNEAPGVFYAFRPQRIEVPMWKDSEAQEIRDLEVQGFTVVLIDKTEENVKRHGARPGKIVKTL